MRLGNLSAGTGGEADLATGGIGTALVEVVGRAEGRGKEIKPRRRGKSPPRRLGLVDRGGAVWLDSPMGIVNGRPNHTVRMGPALHKHMASAFPKLIRLFFTPPIFICIVY
jgi:hypothetical protein